MKPVMIKWKIVPVIVALSAFIWGSSCNNSDESGKNSTTGITDTTGNTDNTLVSPGDTTTTGRTSATKRTGKVSVAIVAENKADKMTKDQTGYYNYAENSPAFSGGQTAIENYINNNIEYPQDAIDNNVEGTIKVQFGIDENGNITNVKTVGDKLGHGLEEAAIKVISNMPKWTPGQVKGKNVKTWSILPITYRIDG